MSHHTTTTAIAPQPTGELAVATPQMAEMPAFNPAMPEMPDTEALKKGQVSQFQSNPIYHEFSPGQEVTGYYLGVTPHTCIDKQTGLLKTLNAVVFYSKEGRLKMNAASLFRQYFHNKPSGHPFHVKMTGIIPKNGKNIQEFQFFEVTI